MSILIERVSYHDEASAKAVLRGSIFQYCTFDKITLDGGESDSLFVSCELNDLDWYWGLFNGCIFVDTCFKNCTFRGSNFADCRFLDCEFLNCKFEKDNMDSPCSFKGSKQIDGKVISCTGFII